jgi:capsid portal protein
MSKPVVIRKAGAKASQPLKSSLTLIAPPRRVHKKEDGTVDTSVMDLVVTGPDSYPEDTFSAQYQHQNNSRGVVILEPVFKPGTLNTLVTQNNILSQCVEAMEVNIDGTGHTIELIHEVEGQPEPQGEDKKEKEMLDEFFAEPYPGKSMVTIRRALRTDLESNGNGYLEVRRNLQDEIMTLDHLEAENMRLVRLDDPVTVSKKMRRGNKEMDVQVSQRERRFVQIINGKKTYFREFGSSRQLNKRTGQWAEKGATIPAEQRASEVMHFKVKEYNLDFFEAGGLPPVLIMIQGGYLAQGVKEELSAHLNAAGAVKHRAAIVEAMSASGSLDAAGSVKMSVERFGAERQQDSMFQAYDKNSEEHVRTAFRLPPMFVGRAQDYNFATAMTGYMVAEAQVFAPERLEFDERMNVLCKALGATKFKFKSKPITLADVANQIKGVEMASTGKIATPESLIKAINKLTGLQLEHQDPPEPTAPEGPGAVLKPGEKPAAKPATKPAAGGDKNPKGVDDPTATRNQQVSKHDHPTLALLAHDWATVLGLNGPNWVLESTRVTEVQKQVSALDGEELKVFNSLLALKSLAGVNHDLDGLARLCGCADDLILDEA